MKYVVLKVKKRVKGGEPMVREFPIIFPEGLSHSDVAACLALHCPELKGATPVSAGFVSSMAIGEKDAFHGKSESLGGLQSRGNVDAALIACWDYLHGMVN